MSSEPSDTVDSLLRAVASAPPDRGVALGEGDVIGRFVIRSRIGEGAQGRVFLAHDPKLDRLVALKVPRRAAALEQEARAAAKVEHPGIARIYEVDAEYIAMEWVDGESLRAALKRGRVADARRIALAVCGAVGAAHAQGVTHCDLKPENVLIAKDGTIRVVDFGLARRGDDDAARGGTPGYVAPEAQAGATPRATADVYALGVMLRELGVGSPRIVERCLQQDPERRFRDARALRDALLERPSKLWMIALVAGAAALATATTWNDAPPRPRERRDPAGAILPLASEETRVLAASSPALPYRAPAPSASTVPPSIPATPPLPSSRTMPTDPLEDQK